MSTTTSHILPGDMPRSDDSKGGNIHGTTSLPDLSFPVLPEILHFEETDTPGRQHRSGNLIQNFVCHLRYMLNESGK
jgi:hypothetical protein